jgi:peptidoglycan/LPS O-acetylase OafA/YrhL
VGNKRLDIQGLRALAVILVIANHVTGWPGGGFVGVDVFFVISGFVITSSLVRERSKTGSISLVEFYKRRVRRILPAALTVTVVTVGVSFVLFGKARFEALLLDALSATFFSANWRFIATGTDYLHAGEELSPMQHFWSLSIEEQFYFVWPLLLVLAIYFGARRPLRNAALALSLVALVSLGFAVWETAVSPASAYFSTFSRAWELAAGALLALSTHKLGGIPDRARPVLAWSGLAVIVAGSVLMTTNSAFPGPGALVPVLGTAAVIAAGVGGRQHSMWLLTNPVAGYLGNISYSLYLWHFPVLVFTTVFLEGTPRRLVVVALLITLALSAASYRWIEGPTRFAKGHRQLTIPVVALAGILSVALVIVSFAPVAPPPAVAAGPPVPRGEPTVASAARWAAVDAAASATTWPDDLTPAIDAVSTDDLAPEWIVDECLGLESENLDERLVKADRCVYGDADSSKIAIIFGDSVALSWAPGVRAALEPLGYRIDILTSERCPPANIPTVEESGAPMDGCAEFRDWALQRIATIAPDLVIVGNSTAGMERLASGRIGQESVEEWADAANDTLSQLEAAAGRVVILRAPPARVGFSSCARQYSDPKDCRLRRSGSYGFVSQADRIAIRGLEVEYIDTENWFCTPAGICPSFAEGTPVLADGFHLTATQSTSLAPLLAEVLSPPEPLSP